MGSGPLERSCGGLWVANEVGLWVKREVVGRAGAESGDEEGGRQS